jgi:hypothetical protein
MTWTIAHRAAHSNIESLQEQIVACEKRAATGLAQTVRAANAALAAKKQEINRLQESKGKSKQLQRAKEKKEQELASGEANESPGRRASPRPKVGRSPGANLRLSAGEQRDIIPGVLDLMVDSIQRRPKCSSHASPIPEMHVQFAAGSCYSSDARYCRSVAIAMSLRATRFTAGDDLGFRRG